MSWKVGFSRNLILKLHNKFRFFHIDLEEKSHKNFTNKYEITKFNKLADVKWIILSGLCIMVEENSYRIQIRYQKKTEFADNRRIGNQLKNNHSLQLEKCRI